MAAGNGMGGLVAELRDGLLILTLDLPPSNALRPALRADLLAALRDKVPGCRAVVIAGAGVNFSSAVALEPDMALPALAAVTDAIAGCPVPVVAALHGLVMGPGAELALAASARVASAGCRIAFPDIVLGLCPEAGTTRRLPALVGAERAVRLLLTGRAIGLDEATGIGLIDQPSRIELLADAMTLAGRLAAGETLPRRENLAADWQAALHDARRAQPAEGPAVGRIIDCVEAGFLLPPAMAQAFERVAREDLEASPEAAALRAVARAELRAATLPPAVARAQGLPVDCLGLAGDAPGLELLARAALSRGLPVLWAEAAPESLARLGQGGGLLETGVDLARVAKAPLQVHASPPGAATLRQVAPGAALVTLAAAEGDLGLAIAPSGRLCELAVLAEESADAIATAITGLRRIGLPPVLVGQRPVLGQRLAAAGELALRQMQALGVAPSELDAILHPLGAPLAETDVTMSRPVQPMAPQDIRNRWLAALANEALRLLDQGTALRPSDVDHLLVAGHGFPRWQGGPMHQADRRGLLVLRHDLRLWAQDHPLWSPAPLLDRLIQDGLRLSALDG